MVIVKNTNNNRNDTNNNNNSSNTKKQSVYMYDLHNFVICYLKLRNQN